MPARRILMTIGQAGDRGDESIIELTRATWSCDPDLVIVKELPKYLPDVAEPGWRAASVFDGVDG